MDESPKSVASKMAELETQELDNSMGPDSYAQLLLCYLIEDDLTNARLLWQRVPSGKREAEGSQVAAAWKVGQAIGATRLPDAYRMIQEIQWNENIKPYADELRSCLSERTWNLVAKAYTSISLSQLCSMTGVPEAEGATRVQERGWQMDADTKMVRPPRKEVMEQVSAVEKERQMSALIDYISYLEN